MLLMRYDIALDDAGQLEKVRARARERGPLFDGMDGLAWKLFLADPMEPTYATLYGWSDPAAAARFLDGPFFEALCASFGRPDVRLLLPRAVTVPPPGLLSITRCDSATDLSALDVRDGSSFHAQWGDAAAGAGRRFEVMYLARGNASTQQNQTAERRG